MNNQTCSVCGADLRSQKITYVQTIGDKVYIVADVPADVCPRCGEEYLSPDTVDAIQSAIEEGKTPQTIQVPVYHLSGTHGSR